MPEIESQAQVRETVDTWAAAERAGDVPVLRSLLTDDFAGIGPHGFQLDKAQWLDRYDSGALLNEAFTTEDLAVRPCGDNAAIVNGVQIQTAAYQGQSFPGRYRFTAVLARRGDAWVIANLQLSPMADQ